MDARQLETAPRRLDVEIPPLGKWLAEQRLVERDGNSLAPLARLDEGLREGAAEAEGLADRAHFRAEPALGPGEFLELEPGRLHRDVVERGLERRRRLLRDVVRKLVERVADCEQRRELRNRKAGRLAGECGRARDARVHLDHAQLVRLRMHRELHVRATRGDTDCARGRERRLAQLLVRGVGQRLLRRDRPRVAGVHAHRVEVLDRADDDGVARTVDHHLELVLLPAGEVLLDEHLPDRARGEPAGDRVGELGLRQRDPAAGAAECERGPHDRRHLEVDLG